MPTFGFSAFLKLLSLNDRPQRTAIKTRLKPSKGGYDYHRSLKLRAHRYLVDGEPIDDVIASCTEITKSDEQRSAQNALKNLSEWRSCHPGPISNFQPKIYESPSGLFKVHFTPDFGLEVGGLQTATHIYNTKVSLTPRMVYAALSLFPDLYLPDAHAPQTLGVLSLREPRFYQLSEVADHTLLGQRVVAALDNIVSEVREELELPPAPPPGPHPPGP